jgi:hypothetical protein
MKKLVIILLLLSSHAWAGWVSIGENDTGTSYADPDTITRKGDAAKMSSLLDYKDFQRMVEVGYFSQKTQAEYDCKERKLRALTLSLHAEHMGAGKVIYADESPHEWEVIDAGTRNETLWKIACK